MSDLPAPSSADALGLATQSYEEFLDDIKGRIRSAQARAARAINAELIGVYWQIGKEIERRQAEAGPERGRRTQWWCSGYRLICGRLSPEPPGSLHQLDDVPPRKVLHTVCEISLLWPSHGKTPANLARMRSNSPP